MLLEVGTQNGWIDANVGARPRCLQPGVLHVALTYQRVVKGAMRDDGRGNRIPDCKVRIAVDGNGTFSRIEAIELRWIGRTHCRKPTR